LIDLVAKEWPSTAENNRTHDQSIFVDELLTETEQ